MQINARQFRRPVKSRVVQIEPAMTWKFIGAVVLWDEASETFSVKGKDPI